MVFFSSSEKGMCILDVCKDGCVCPTIFCRIIYKVVGYDY
jgi:hypothetical protein